MELDIDIYRIANKLGSSFLHEEVCRNCAKEKEKEGFEIEFDNYLYRYTFVKDGISYYQDEKNPEITCSLCGEYLVSEEKYPLEFKINEVNSN